MSDFGPDVIEQLRSVLSDHGYIMGEQLGRGGYSVVFKVRLVRFEQDLAAKITNTASPRHKSAESATTNEERALIRLNHPNIIRFYQSFRFQNYSFLILELCPGKSMKHRIDEFNGLPLPDLYNLMAAISDALTFIHANHYVHRDIKPGNILFDSSGRPKIADFGMCIPAPEGELLTDFLGSPNYCPPEILKHHPYDPYKADVWALGVTFLEMAIGPHKLPKGQGTIPEDVVDHGILIPPETPSEIESLVRGMVDLTPQHRPSLAEVRKSPLFDLPVKEVARKPEVVHVGVMRPAKEVARTEAAQVGVRRPQRTEMSSSVRGLQKVPMRRVKSRTSNT
jgi:serine/threonine protein kinase